MRNKPSERSLDNLKGVHPALSAVVVLAMSRSGQDFGVSEGVRSEARQEKLVADGFSKTMRSKHLVQNTGFGHAVDLYPSGFKTVAHITDGAYQAVADAIKSAADDLGVVIEWGYDLWEWDKPHFQFKGIK